MSKVSRQSSGLFCYLLVLTGFFILLEISFAIQGSGLYLGDFEYISNHILIPRSVFPPILFYFLAQMSVHLVFTLIVWLSAGLLGKLFRYDDSKTQRLGIDLWCVYLLTVLLANEQFFPNSKFADLMRLMLPLWIANKVFLLFAALSALALSASVLMAVILLVKRWPLWTLLAGICFGSAAFSFSTPTLPLTSGATAEKPNIILIGIDSLRPDLIGKFTPHLNDFLTSATLFTDAYTPIARTFPSWISILTGLYPKHNRARFDLMDQTHLDYRHTLPMLLKNAGYTTLFAMDETRFSNMNSDLGFDTIVTPPMGLNDFLLGTFNDFPLSNLVVNTVVGKWLFPYSYGNRPAFVTYNPDSFLNLVKPALLQAHAKPLFLAVHFCLPHYPYFWADYGNVETWHAYDHYEKSIQRVDQQVNDFFQLLSAAGLLQHSIVVLLSDHGEALELNGDRVTSPYSFIAGAANPHHIVPRFYPATYESEQVDQAAGHGTDVLSLTQSHSVLAFRFYGFGKQNYHAVHGLVSLMDIKPTVLAALNINDQSDGVSLQKYLTGAAITTPLRADYFLESDFSPQAVRSVHPEMRKVVLEGLDFFQVHPHTLQLTVKNNMGAIIISAKQYADIHGEWMLALYPQRGNYMAPVLINLRTGQWTNDLSVPFAQQAPLSQILTAMHRFYGTDLSTIATI